MSKLLSNFAALVITPFLVLILFAGNTQATIITVPTDLNPGAQYRLVFVTDATRDATSPNIADYNTFVTAAVTAAAGNGFPALDDLGTTWRAIASANSVDARDNTETNPNVTIGVPIYRLDDTRVADNNADLWDGSISSPISTTPYGFSPVRSVYTGTNTLGTRFPTHILGFPEPRMGITASTNGSWISDLNAPINNALRPYFALSGILTVPIPEPSTFALAALGLLGMGYRRRKRA